MPSLTVRPESEQSLVDQIFIGVTRQIDDRQLRPGSKLPSIRNLAKLHNISRFTVVEAYDRLVAAGYLKSRRGAGFYVAPVREEHVVPDVDRKQNAAPVSLVRRLLEASETDICAGGPWLPNSWLDEASIRRSLNVLARKNGAYLLEYGNPFGYLPLREHLSVFLSEIGIVAQPTQIVLTHGTSQAFELIIRLLLRPGDAALVDDPGYYNLYGNLRLNNVRLLGVPRNTDGPDIAVLERLAAEHKPKVYFTQSAMQNPTGTSMSPHNAFRVLQAAEHFDFMVIEDDIFSDLQARLTPRLATLDHLDRVIYARSFSKTLSGSLRVGFIASSPKIANDLTDIKMVTSITTSQFTERLLYTLLADGHYRKYLNRLRERLDGTRVNVMHAFERVGLQLFSEPDAGLFVWARFPHIDDAAGLAERGLHDGIVLAPGYVFRPHLETSPWMRFNVASCEDNRVLSWLERMANERF